ncbi:MAG: hypothetical protein LQ350_001484 [Teloschistes chrysophthalmus]|nr:MAG: hypothetical protein LQ350_001484 [Niorma chrysophthalma]
MRFFPKFLHPIVAVFTPYAWLRSKKQGDEDPSSNEKSEGVLQWMIDIARDNEENPRTLAQQALFLALAAIHTTTIVTTQVLFDLGARPEYIQPIRDEILQALEDEGKEVGKDGWQKSALDKMPKLDSFMKESPRLAPQTLSLPHFLTPFPKHSPERSEPSAPLVILQTPSQAHYPKVAFSRVALSPITLSDGFHLPRGTHFTIPSANLLQDPSIIPNPEAFDGFRYYNASSQSTERQNQFTATDSNNLSFGHGKYACPGRYLASYKIKLIVAMLLVRYDIGFPKGKGRPRSISYADNMFPDPTGEILLKERAKK